MGYTEADTRAKLIDPQIKSSDWLESHIVREYYFTDGRKLIGGKRGKQYFVDYLLAYKNTNLAIIEAKAENRDPLDGLQQSINYAQKLKVIDIETTYVGADGIPLRTDEFLEFLLGVLNTLYHDETKLREIWSDPTTREELLGKLRDMHIDEMQLNDLKQMFEAQQSDIYDVLAHLSFNLDIKTRSERAFAVHHRKYIEKYHNDKVREFLDFILERYEKDGVKEMGSDKLSSLIKLSGMELRELKDAFVVDGTSVRDGYFGLQKKIYR